MTADQDSGNSHKGDPAGDGPALSQVSSRWLTSVVGPDSLSGPTGAPRVTLPWPVPAGSATLRIVVPASLVHGLSVESAEVLDVPAGARLNLGREISAGTGA